MLTFLQSEDIRCDKSHVALGSKRLRAAAAALVCLAAFAPAANAQEREVSISGKEIVERLGRLEEGQKHLEQRITDVEKNLSQRITDVEKKLGERISEVEKNLNQRISDVEKNLNQRIGDGEKNLTQRIADGEKNLDQRIRELRDFMMWGFGVTFAGIFALIGFVLWDRRTALAPAVRRIEELHDREQRLESALRDYAGQSPDLANSLRKSGLL